MDPYYLSPAEERELAIGERRKLMQALDAAHTALRMVDASDVTEVQPDKTLEAVADAVEEVERIAREIGHKLPEFRLSGWADKKAHPDDPGALATPSNAMSGGEDQSGPDASP